MILHTWEIFNLQCFPNIRNVYERSLKLRKTRRNGTNKLTANEDGTAVEKVFSNFFRMFYTCRLLIIRA